MLTLTFFFFSISVPTILSQILSPFKADNVSSLFPYSISFLIYSSYCFPTWLSASEISQALKKLKDVPSLTGWVQYLVKKHKEDKEASTLVDLLERGLILRLSLPRKEFHVLICSYIHLLIHLRNIHWNLFWTRYCQLFMHISIHLFSTKGNCVPSSVLGIWRKSTFRGKYGDIYQCWCFMYVN